MKLKNLDLFFVIKKLQKGFTLIELLVVVSIIGILASLALVSYQGAQKQARDSQRKSDLAQYRNGLENYATAHGSLYPIFASAEDAATVCARDLAPDYLSSCSEDPTLSATNPYQYLSNSEGTEYVLWAKLEAGDYWWICSTGKSAENDRQPTDVADCATL